MKSLRKLMWLIISVCAIGVAMTIIVSADRHSHTDESSPIMANAPGSPTSEASGGITGVGANLIRIDPATGKPVPVLPGDLNFQPNDAVMKLLAPSEKTPTVMTDPNGLKYVRFHRYFLQQVSIQSVSEGKPGITCTPVSLQQADNPPSADTNGKEE